MPKEPDKFNETPMAMYLDIKKEDIKATAKRKTLTYEVIDNGKTEKDN